MFFRILKVSQPISKIRTLRGFLFQASKPGLVQTQSGWPEAGLARSGDLSVHEAVSGHWSWKNRDAHGVLFSDKGDWPGGDSGQRIHFNLIFRRIFNNAVNAFSFPLSTMEITTCAQPKCSQAG
jgi:hypothetical protein